VTLSTHKCEVVRITEILTHDNSDNLELIKIWGYITVARKGEYKLGDLAVFIPPDSMVDTNLPEFSFLSEAINPQKKIRIKARKLRGIVSWGLLIPAPPNACVGDDMAEFYNITHYEPQMQTSTGGEAVKAPRNELEDSPFVINTFDVDSFQRYSSILEEGREIVIVEKVHGSQHRSVFTNDKFM
jgi:RNA ligase (TIGR02306 family)